MAGVSPGRLAVALHLEPVAPMPRYVRHRKRKLTRAELLALNRRRRPQSVAEKMVTTKVDPDPAPSGVPYDPVRVPVRKIPESLADIDDVSVIVALRDADPRTSARSHYDARIAVLTEGG